LQRGGAMIRDGDDMVELLRLLGHPLRFGLLRRMAQGPVAVGDLAANTGQSVSVISQQLALLRKAGLVQGRRQVKQVFYSLARPRMAEVAQALSRMAQESWDAGEEPAPPPCKTMLEGPIPAR
jgi:DNA-binding transcriptional ArsR family regulator